MKNKAKKIAVIAVLTILFITSILFTKYHYALLQENRDGFSRFEWVVLNDSFSNALTLIILITGTLIIWEIVSIIAKALTNKKHS